MSGLRLDVYLIPVISLNNKVLEKLDSFNGDQAQNATIYDCIAFHTKKEAINRFKIFKNWEISAENFTADPISSENQHVKVLVDELKDIMIEYQNKYPNQQIDLHFNVEGYLKYNDDEANYFSSFNLWCN